MTDKIEVSELARVFADLNDGFGDFQEKVLKDFGKNLLENIVISTPVDTGRARANWSISIDEPNSATTDETDWGLNLFEEAKKIENLVENDRNIYLSNNLPYINRLNDGWSAQAPKEFVEIATLQAVKNLPKILRSYRRR